jgi:mono/diheme cytochrome c family protein
MRTNNILTISAGILVLLSSVTSLAQQSHIGTLTGNARHGKDLYRRFCIYCHGAFGDGRGDSAPYLDPKPRDFTKATYKCRSTPSGSLPLDSDLYDTISRGVHASGMPSWKPLTKQQRADLVAYVKSFSTRFEEEKPGETVQLPAETPNSAESAQHGAELFQNMNCWACHGKEGRGNGPSAKTLTDSRGFPITPFDLTSGMQLKCGDSGRAMVRDLITGLDGTPMPSFLDAMKPEEAWDLVHYIETLRAAGKKNSQAKKDGPIKTEPKGE